MKKSKSTKKQFVKQEKPTDDELADRWITKYPNTIHILGGFRRYGNGFWPEIHHPTVEAEILGILEAAKQEKIRPNKGLKNSVMDLARIKTTKANERMDDNPSILVLKNGTLDLGTYELLDHDQDFYASSALSYKYDPDAKAVNFHKILSRMSIEEVNLLQEYAGYCLTLYTQHEISIWIIGPSGSGKSAIITAFQTLLGNMGYQLSLSDMERSKFTLKPIVGRRLIFSTEQFTNKPTMLDNLNKIISGEPLWIEEKFEPGFTYTPHAKILWASSDLPTIPQENGFYRRFKFISMPALPEELRDPNLKERIKREGSGILNWALEGLKRLDNRGYFLIPSSVKYSTEQIQGNNDHIMDFISECCDKDSRAKEQSQPLYESYCNYCSTHGHEDLSTVDFARKLESHGFEGTKSNGRRYWHGLKLNEGKKNIY